MNERKKVILRKKGVHFLIGAVRTVFLISMCFVILYPILYMISISFRTVDDIFDPTVIWIPKTFTTENFREVFKMINYFPRLFNTVKISLIATVINVAICAFAGYGFARFDFKFKAILFGCVLFSIIVPPQSISIPMYLGYKSFDFLGLGTAVGWLTGKPVTVNLLNTPFTIYVPALLGAGIKSGLFIYIFRQFFRNLPKELEDAACIDGCSIIRTYFRIMIPNSSAAFVSCFLFSFVWYWNDYSTVTMYFNEPVTLSASLSLIGTIMKGNMYANISSNPYISVFYTQCACLLCILPLLILYIFLQRLFTESIEHSGIVG